MLLGKSSVLDGVEDFNHKQGLQTCWSFHGSLLACLFFKRSLISGYKTKLGLHEFRVRGLGFQGVRFNGLGLGVRLASCSGLLQQCVVSPEPAADIGLKCFGAAIGDFAVSRKQQKPEGAI